MGSMFSCRDLESRAHNYMLERFEFVCKTEEFLKLGKSGLFLSRFYLELNFQTIWLGKQLSFSSTNLKCNARVRNIFKHFPMNDLQHLWAGNLETLTHE